MLNNTSLPEHTSLQNSSVDCLPSRERISNFYPCPAAQVVGTLSKDDDDGSENVVKKMNLRSFKLTRVYLVPLNTSNAGDFSWS